MAARTGITRREILTGAAAASLGGIAGCFPSVGGQWPDAGPDTPASEAGYSTCGCAPPDGGATGNNDDQPSPVQGSSTVVTIQRDDSIDTKGSSLDQARLDVVASMVDAVLSALATGAKNPWSVILPTAGPCTRIGLKVNCLNPYFSTSPAVVRAVIKNLLSNLGVCPGNIWVWDRGLDELKSAGKYLDGDFLLGARLVGTYNSPDDTRGPGYSEAVFGTFQGSTPRLSRILTEETDLTINLPVFKRHSQSGVTGALKNIYGVIDIPGNFHNSVKNNTSLQTALPALYNIPVIRKSIKLTIVDALRAVINADTQNPVDALPGRIFGSLDPLALDYYALDLLNQMRAARRLDPIGSDVTQWLDNAYTMGLGAKSYNLVTLSATGDVTNDGGIAGLENG